MPEGGGGCPGYMYTLFSFSNDVCSGLCTGGWGGVGAELYTGGGGGGGVAETANGDMN